MACRAMNAKHRTLLTKAERKRPRLDIVVSPPMEVGYSRSSVQTPIGGKATIMSAMWKALSLRKTKTPALAVKKEVKGKDKRQGSRIAAGLIDTLATITRLVGDLDKTVEEHVNTKKEIKEIKAKLLRGIDRMNREDIRKWLETQKIGKQVEPKCKAITQTVENYPENERDRLNIEKALAEPRIANKFKNISRIREWPNGMYINTAIEASEEKIRDTAIIDIDERILQPNLTRYARREPHIKLLINESRNLGEIK